MLMVELVAYLGIVVLACLAIFQIALIAGAPIGRFSWGGAHSVLPAPLRIASASSLVLYIFFAAVLLGKAGEAPLISSKFAGIAIWVITAYFFLGILMNAISRSKPERLVMTPTALILAIVFLVVALS
jgi:hypothetical protein